MQNTPSANQVCDDFMNGIPAEAYAEHEANPNVRPTLSAHTEAFIDAITEEVLANTQDKAHVRALIHAVFTCGESAAHHFPSTSGEA